jgi:hypothetical protein
VVVLSGSQEVKVEEGGTVEVEDEAATCSEAVDEAVVSSKARDGAVACCEAEIEDGRQWQRGGVWGDRRARSLGSFKKLLSVARERERERERERRD